MIDKITEMKSMKVEGGCLCGAVRYSVDGPMRQITACHCNQCRKLSGHFAAATAALRTDIQIDGAVALTWYQSSPNIRRAFCKTCGSHLFWDVDGRDELSIFSGSLEGQTGLKLVDHIFCADKGNYYQILDDLPRYDAYAPGDGNWD